MRRTFLVLAALCVRALAPLPGMAQEVIPIIRLSPDEAAKTKKVAQVLIDAQERNAKAQLAWDQFYKSYAVTHPDLRNLRFTEDCRFAVASVNSPAPFLNEVTVGELAPETRQKLADLRRELNESMDAKKQAMKTWEDYENQFLADHVGTAASNDRTGEILTVDGKQVPIPIPWSNGLAFTPDFSMAVPRG